MGKIPASISEIQAMQIAPEEITYLVQELAQQHQERGSGEIDDFHTAVAILAERYRDREPNRPLCVIERVRCLAALITDNRMCGWTLQGIEEGCLLTNEAIFRATAKCPLRADAERVWFDADEFFEIVLRETEPQARA
jgi:hypothetical protein